ncbi:MAG: DUF4339 domain-containing protein [Verrucomicrobiota bacterium]|nr:DUF4339 domain-containing protein [Verrucomicrobiota bacterium]
MFWPDLTTAVLASTAVGLLSAYIAHRRGRNPLGWFAIGFFFGLLGILAIFFAPPSRKEKEKEMPSQPIKPVPKPYLFGPINKFWYYLDPSHQQVGPMSYEAVSNAWKEGKISPKTFVWNEDLEEWKPLQDLIRLQN